MANVQQEIEIWKDVIGYKEIYEISNLGRIRQKKTGNVLVGGVSKKGYCSMALSMNGNIKRKYIHRLVMQSFIGECPVGLEVLHGDDNPRNNKLSNLSYGTRSENVMGCISRGRFNNGMKGRTGDLHCQNKPVNMFDTNKKFIRRLGGVSEAARLIGCTQSGVTHAIKKGRPIKGYIFCLEGTGEPMVTPLTRKKNQKEVIQMSMNGEEIKRHQTLIEASKVTGIDYFSIRYACVGKIKKGITCGFMWRYAS